MAGSVLDSYILTEKENPFERHFSKLKNVAEHPVQKVYNSICESTWASIFLLIHSVINTRLQLTKLFFIHLWILTYITLQHNVQNWDILLWHTAMPWTLTLCSQCSNEGVNSNSSPSLPSPGVRFCLFFFQFAHIFFFSSTDTWG